MHSHLPRLHGLRLESPWESDLGSQWGTEITDTVIPGIIHTDTTTMDIRDAWSMSDLGITGIMSDALIIATIGLGAKARDSIEIELAG